MKVSHVVVVAVVAATVALVALAAMFTQTALAGATRRGFITVPVWQQGGYERVDCWNVTRRAELRWARGFIAGKGFIEIGEDYVNAVMSILQSDPDTAKLLQEGYNVTWVRPIITAVVTGKGEVTLRAPQALVLLRGPSATAHVLVDVSQGKVLRIELVSRTVITKS